MRLVDDDQEIVFIKIDEAGRRHTRGQSGQVAGIVFDPGADPGLAEHLHIEVRPLPDPLCLQQFIFTLKIRDALIQFFFDVDERFVHPVLRHHVKAGRQYRDVFHAGLDLSGQGIDLRDAVDLISEEFDAVCVLIRHRWQDLDHIAADPEGTSLEIHVVPVVLNVDQFADAFIPVFLHARTERDAHARILIRIADAVDAGNGRHDDHVSPFHQ